MIEREILKLLGINIPLAIVIFFVLRWLAQRTIEAKIDVLKSQEIESFKHKLTQALELAKHQLQLEHAKQSVVYEYQRVSFNKVIHAMYDAVRAIEDKYDYNEESWKPILESEVEDFRKVYIAESLFIRTECEHVLNSFVTIMADAVLYPHEQFYPYEQFYPDSNSVRRTCDQLIFLSGCIRDFFRSQIGLQIESQPLFDAAIVGACRMINKLRFPEVGLPTEGILRWQEIQSTEDLVSIARKNLGVLQEELEKLISNLKSNPKEARFFSDYLFEAERYLSTIRQNDSCGE